jgi:hypothetical protein
MSLRKQTRDQIQASIAANREATVPRSGIGLVLTDGRKRNTLVDQAGQLTPWGKFYYEQTGKTQPTKFDFTQEPQRKGRGLTTSLLDGTKKVVGRFDSVTKTFKTTAMGRVFYKNRKVRHTVLFPVSVDLARKIEASL